MTKYFERSNSTRGKPIIFCNMYIYNFHRRVLPNKERYRCKNRKCKGSIVVEEDMVVSKVSHYHPTEASKIKGRKILTDIRKRARETNEYFSAIINNVVANITANISNVEALVMLESIRDMVKKDRNKVVGYQPALAIDIPDFLKKDRSNNDFLRYDSGITDESRFIIFMHKEKEKIFKNVKCISIDGTFKSVPRLFYQCVVKHGMLLSKSWAL
ncbi:hypothetical protein DMUE_3003 [Dictyocoela muelleri]|nr:hypothetical protein DMUE_3003 [Dictyocoela muelleri]